MTQIYAVNMCACILTFLIKILGGNSQDIKDNKKTKTIVNLFIIQNRKFRCKDTNYITKKV